MHVVPAETVFNEEKWHREIVEPRVRDIQGVSAARWRNGTFPWRVNVYVMQFVQGVPLEPELRRRIGTALRAVPGVTEVEETEVYGWLAHGEPVGPALVEALAPVVDALARDSHMELAQSLPDAGLEQLVAAIETLPTNDALYLDDVGWFQVLRFDAYDGKNPRTNERVEVPAKTQLNFEAHGNFLNVLNGRPREDLGDPTQSNRDNVTILRYDWAKRLATCMAEELCARGVLHIAGFGSLCIDDGEVDYDYPPRRSAEKRVRWTMSEALRQRLAAATSRRTH